MDVFKVVIIVFVDESLIATPEECVSYVFVVAYHLALVSYTVDYIIITPYTIMIIGMDNDEGMDSILSWYS